MRLSRAPVTAALLAAIGLAFVLEVAAGGSSEPEVLIRLGANYAPLVAEGEVWRLVSCMFLHIGLFHLAVNGWALYQLGALMEIWVGSLPFLGIYFVAGLGGSLASYLWTQGLSAGASGAIFGILGALITFLARRRDRLRPAAKALLLQLLFWAGLNLFLGFTIPGIDNAGHLGGLAAGLALGGFLRDRTERWV